MFNITQKLLKLIYIVFIIFYLGHNRNDYLSDINLILENCIFYNGKNSKFTKKARKIVSETTKTLGT